MIRHCRVETIRLAPTFICSAYLKVQRETMIAYCEDDAFCRLPYGDIFGGASALTREQILKVNGFSNDYWGWGGEDDDMATRCFLLSSTVRDPGLRERQTPCVGRDERDEFETDVFLRLECMFIETCLVVSLSTELSVSYLAPNVE